VKEEDHDKKEIEKEWKEEIERVRTVFKKVENAECFVYRDAI